jgi:PAS domain S-box-containing protein
VLSLVLSHGLHASTALVRCLISLSAIGITTVLALRHQDATIALRSQADLLNLTHDTIFVRDMKDVITYWNRGAEEQYGWAAAEAIGKVSHQLMQTIFPEPLADITAKLLRAGRWEGELIHTRGDGSRVTVESRWALQQDALGQPCAILETNTDITERKHAEEKLLQQEQALQIAIDTIPTLVWRTDPDGAAQFFNQRWLEYTGIAFEDARDWGWSVAIHPDDFPHLNAQWRQFLAAGKRGETEARFRRFDGEYRWFLFRAEPLRDRSGNVTSWYGANIDIQDIKRAEEALRRSEAYSVQAQRLSLTGSFGRKTETDEIFWSEEMYRIFGYEPEVTPTTELIKGRVHPDDMTLYQDALDRIAHGEPDINVQYRLLMPDHSIKHVRVLAHATVDEADRPQYVGAVMDVTAAIRAENDLQAAHAELAHVTRVATLGELTASIAHEVNQPLAAIVTNGEACLRWLGREEPHLEEAGMAVARMIGEGRRASEVVRRLRAFSRKDAPQRLAININEVIDDSIPLIQRELSTHRVVLRLELAPQLPPVLGDRIQLQQVIINLMVNGIQSISAAAGPRKLVVGSEQSADGTVVTVSDSGTGIDTEVADRLFDAFFSTKPSGMGMGLSICRSIIEAHGGRIWASNNDGPGASFRFLLPSEDHARPQPTNGLR